MARPATAAEMRERFRVAPHTRLDLGRIDASETLGHRKEEAGPVLEAGRAHLDSLQERLWAGAEHAVLIVLQGMDTAGKDGTIRHVMSGFNPQGCQVAGFKIPTPEEAAHDYLWRAHRATPARGNVTIFNRSHYEDVLVVRVHELVPRAVWRRHYAEINDFEALLARSGTTVMKFFLHISPEEQRARLQARLDNPGKLWKFSKADLVERKLWPAYRKAYEDALTSCSTAAAPWYVIPANHKWFRDLAVAEIVGATLDDLGLRYPEPKEDLTGVVVI